jgi:hypothetical protein
MTTYDQHTILFIIFTAFFVILGLIAVGAIAGLIKVDKSYYKWIFGSFISGITATIFVWAKTPPLDLFVILSPPTDIPGENFELVSGTYEYGQQSGTDKSPAHSGALELTPGEGQIGTWIAKFPYEVMDKAVKLTMKDRDGHDWEVQKFYPNRNSKQLIRIQSPPQLNAAASSMIIDLLGKSAFAAGKEVKVNNYSKIIGKFNNRTFYRWRVFVDEPDQILNTIAEVQYLLHPTFPNPLRVQTDPKAKFALETVGWGQFLIEITIKYKDKSTANMEYSLDFKKKWP